MNVASTKTMVSGALRRLVQDGVLSNEDATEANETSRKQKIPLFTYLTDNNIVDASVLCDAASSEYGVPVLDVKALDFATMPKELVSDSLIEKHQVLPLFMRSKKVFIGISDPTNVKALEEIRFHTNLTIEPILIRQDHLIEAIEESLKESSSVLDDLEDEGLENLEYEDEDPNEAENDSSEDMADSPAVKLVNKVLLDAIKRGASDIHFEPYEKTYRVRYRIDGMLKTVIKPPKNMTTKIASRLKVMSKLDIAEKRVPQDGRVKLNLTKTKSIDFRLSTCPTLFGEKVVMRVLDASAARMGIDKLGYEDDQKQLFMDAIVKPYGMVLVTGPTGSGKTVSLYTALNILNTEGRNISTVEDPVEIRVNGINQVQQNAKQGMTFSAALRSFLRQDPDIIMVGEIRDLETAEIAVKAAQTGHMVLSTLHTNNAPETVSRMINMGVAPFNIVSAVSLIIAQRLARRLCDCKKPTELTNEALIEAGFTEADLEDATIFDPSGCSKCNEGYKGRVGIYEVMPITDNIKKIILEGGNSLDIADQADKDGISNLRKSALLKVKNGLIGLVEANRVTVD
ncbi:type IV-A pilus assembly ATPase PilB [Marinicella litoralis]|uniref:Type IV pilus assembly protein PilB n=1 Tax=Marinicella litoralis TaxID=644220 RepID=A0A4R6XV79_9GAMM|nr:type IV-A pilus assembly ATPase PilB [Marinicella litoralis]TDR22449.1 type IV pilus assembly protein PilB [Marinicella litoralis]